MEKCKDRKMLRIGYKRKSKNGEREKERKQKAWI